MANVIIQITPNVYNKHTRAIVCSMEKFTNFHVKIGKLVMLETKLVQHYFLIPHMCWNIIMYVKQTLLIYTMWFLCKDVSVWFSLINTLLTWLTLNHNKHMDMLSCYMWIKIKIAIGKYTTSWILNIFVWGFQLANCLLTMLISLFQHLSQEWT